MIPVDSIAVVYDALTDTPVLLLRPKNDQRVLPISLGRREALGIMAAMEGVGFPRPMPQDLTTAVIASLGAHVAWVHINDVRNDTFYARLYVEQEGEFVFIDARPSDALTIALRAHAPIAIDDDVFARAAVEDVGYTSGDPGMLGDLWAYLDKVAGKHFYQPVGGPSSTVGGPGTTGYVTPAHAPLEGQHFLVL